MTHMANTGYEVLDRVIGKILDSDTALLWCQECHGWYDPGLGSKATGRKYHEGHATDPDMRLVGGTVVLRGEEE